MFIPSREFKSSKAARNYASLAINAYNMSTSKEVEALTMQCQNNTISVQDKRNKGFRITVFA